MSITAEPTEEELVALANTANRRLNVWCGVYPMAYWTNLDADENTPAEVHAKVPPLPFKAGQFDEIYAGHFLEHLPYDRAAKFLSECYRVLTPGGRLGIVVPDTRAIMTRWLDESTDAVEYPERVWWPMADLDAVCHVFLYSDVQDSPHRWAYDLDTLARAMTKAGFTGLKEIDRYRDDRIPQGAWYQCGLDGFKGDK